MDEETGSDPGVSSSAERSEGTTAPGDGSSSVERLTPETAFSLLGNDTRMAIMRALWETPREWVSFSELKARAGIADSGQFNYHLGKLVEAFVRRSDDGYRLNIAGVQVMGAVLAGTYTEAVAFEPVAIDEPCPECGGSLVADYEDDYVQIRCRDCREKLSVFAFPPGALAGYEREELPYAFDRWLRSIVGRATAGFCPNCSGRTSGRVLVDPDDVPELDGVGVVFRCARCDDHITAGLGSALLYEPGVVAFYHDHGVDLREVPFWELDWLANADPEIVSEEPLRVAVTIAHDGDRRRFVVDEDVDVVAVEDPD